MMFCEADAAAYVLLAAAEATMVHVPELENCACTVVIPDTAQMLGVVEAKVTGKPALDEARPVSVSGVPTYWAAIVLQVIVCVRRAGFTVKVCETDFAAK